MSSKYSSLTAAHRAQNCAVYVMSPWAVQIRRGTSRKWVLHLAHFSFCSSVRLFHQASKQYLYFVGWEKGNWVTVLTPLVTLLFSLLFSLMGAGSLCFAAGQYPATAWDGFSLTLAGAQQGCGPSEVQEASIHLLLPFICLPRQDTLTHSILIKRVKKKRTEEGPLLSSPKFSSQLARK